MKKYWLLVLIISSSALLVHCSQSSKHILSKEKNVPTKKESDSVHDQSVIDSDNSSDAEESRTKTKFEFYEELPNRPVYGKQY